MEQKSPRRGRPRLQLSKHDQVRRKILNLIKTGKYPPGSRLPSETQLPRYLNVSQQTVRRALNELVREGLIVRRRGSGSFVADHRHPPPLPGRKLKIGLLWSQVARAQNLKDGFLAEITRGVLDELGLEGTTPQFLNPGHHSSTRAEWVRPEAGLKVVCLGEPAGTLVRRPSFKSVKEGKFDGLLSLSVIEGPWLEKVLALNIPTVVVDYPNDNFLTRVDQVFVDPLPGFRLAVRHFIQQGLGRIHFVGKSAWQPAPSEEMTIEEWRAYRIGKIRVDPDSLLRQSAYRQAMAEVGVDVPEDWMHHLLGTLRGEEALVERLAAWPEGRRPQAILCYDVDQADYLIRSFAQRGISLQGAGVSRSREPKGDALAVQVDLREMGAAAAALLVSRLQRPARPFFNVGIGMSFIPPEGDAPITNPDKTKRRTAKRIPGAVADPAP